jgi:hypothetical protein
MRRQSDAEQAQAGNRIMELTTAYMVWLGLGVAETPSVRNKCRRVGRVGASLERRSRSSAQLCTHCGVAGAALRRGMDGVGAWLGRGRDVV